MNATILRRPSTGAERRDQISVTIQDIKPQCFERVALICDWLADQGIERTTLLVVPAPDLHPVNHLSDGLVEWLSEQRNAGACVIDGLEIHCERTAIDFQTLTGLETDTEMLRDALDEFFSA